MKTILVGDCEDGHLLELADPDGPSEAEFEFKVAKVLACLYPAYRCVVFTGTFEYEGRGYRPDLALVASDFSHWFVVEVELLSHSLAGHVLPQVRAFRFGEPQSDCVSILARELSVGPDQVNTLLKFVPRTVAVIANKFHPEWRTALRALDVQFLTACVYSSTRGGEAVELSGSLEAQKEHLGFGKYSATDRSLRFPPSFRLPAGRIQILDPRGGRSWWLVARTATTVWVTKETGAPDIEHDTFVQIIRTYDGEVRLRRRAFAGGCAGPVALERRAEMAACANEKRPETRRSRDWPPAGVQRT